MNTAARRVSAALLIIVMLFSPCAAYAQEIDYDADYTEEQTKGIMNILLLGVDSQDDDIPDPGRSDCMMICSLNLDTGGIKLVSIERAIYVEIPDVGKDLLTHAHHYGGGELTQSLIEDYFSIDLAGYCEINYQGFIEAIDAIGGVDVELSLLEVLCLNGDLNELYPENSAQTWHIVSEGVNHLGGYDSLQYVRMRVIDSDWHRIERQRDFIQLIIDKAKDASPLQIADMIKAVLRYTKTNLSAGQICALIANAYKFRGAVAEQLTVPEHSRPIVCNYPVESEKLHRFIYGEDS